MEENLYGINIVSKKTGLSPHAIRKWESRYEAVIPIRSSTNRRLYTEKQIKRLLNLKKLTDSGYNIGQIAFLSDEKLSELLKELIEFNQVVKNENDIFYYKDDSSIDLVNNAINAIIDYDTINFEKIITESYIKYGNIWTINHFIVPTIYKIGNLWRDGKLRIAQEHLASEILRNFLGNIISNSNISASAPKILITTPSGQLHEFGAIIAAATAATEGWDVCYLGPSLPSEEIASSTLAKNAKVVALSIVFPNDDLNIVKEIKRLRDILSQDTQILIGGRAHKDYKKYLEDTDIKFITSLDEFRSELEKIRKFN